MKRKLAILATSIMLGFSSLAVFLPNVGDGTSLNTWTRNMDGVLAAAKQTGQPIMLVMLNLDDNRGGCSHSRDFMDRTINTQYFTQIANSYQFYMVFLNCYGADFRDGVLRPQNGDVEESYFNKWWSKYTVSNAYPLVAVIGPNGTRYAGWSDSTTPTTKALNFYQTLEKAIAALAVKYTTFSLDSLSPNVLDAQPGSLATWSGRISRSGGSGKDGYVYVNLSGANASNYSLSLPYLQWGTYDGSIDFSISGPYRQDNGIIDDILQVSINAAGFDGSIVSYSTQSQQFRIKDSRIAKSLEEFAAEANVGSFSQTGDLWYVPASSTTGNMLQTLTRGQSVLTWYPSTGGIATFCASSSQGSLILLINGAGNYDISSMRQASIGFSSGDVIQFVASSVSGGYSEIGFSQFDVMKLESYLQNPANGSSISRLSLQQNYSLADLSWNTSLPCNRYDIFNGAGNLLATTYSPYANGINVGLVQLDAPTATYMWTARSWYDCSGLALLNGANEIHSDMQSSFTVVAAPQFCPIPSTIKSYLKFGTWIDVSAAEATVYSASGLPQGMSIDSSTGIITGIPKKIGTYQVGVAASNPYSSSYASFTLVVERQCPAAKGNVQLVAIDENGFAPESSLLKLMSSGKWTMKTMNISKSYMSKGTLSIAKNGEIIAQGNGIWISSDPSRSLWSGIVAGKQNHGSKVVKPSSFWKGSWNMGVSCPANGTLGGYVAAKVAASGKANISGKIMGKMSLSSSGYGAILPAWYVDAYVPALRGYGDMLISHMCKRGQLTGICAIGSNGATKGNFIFKSVGYSIYAGSKWSKPSLSSLNGSTAQAYGCGNASFAISATATSIKPTSKSTGTSASLSKANGISRISFKNGKTSCRGIGIAFVANGQLQVMGGGVGGKEYFAFTIR